VSELLALGFDADASPSITLESLTLQQRATQVPELPYGWGFGWYPGDDRGGTVIKDPTSEGENAMSRVLRDWDSFRSTVFVCHLRGATQRILPRDTQPFIRSFGGRQWIFAHSGDLRREFRDRLPLEDDAAFETIGRTDSEHVFCWLLRTAHAVGARRLAEIGWARLRDLFVQVNAFGPCNFVVTDGHDIVAYQDGARDKPMQWARSTPQRGELDWRSPEVAVALDGARDVNRTVTMFSTLPLSGLAWQPMHAGQLLVARRGAIVWSSHGAETPAPGVSSASTAPMPGTLPQHAEARRGTAEWVTPVDGRTLRVRHRTVYRYDQPVEGSAHLLRLHPIDDAKQQTLAHALSISIPGLRREFEDVFGNGATQFEPSVPFSELVIESRSTVRLRGPMPGDIRSPHRRDQIPLVWMPWQRQMMLPYLLPVELPETQLLELSEFGMSFVERNDYDLVETLLDLNATIYRDFAYVSGSTTVETTPFDVYTERRGVCQDFANLMICLARLLNVPARYRAGYIYTGARHENRMQSEASHAWVELYLPWVGWRGFDPTNGCLAAFDHVRIACGRNYRDAAPTSGTLYKGGGLETLTVDVKVELDSAEDG